MSEDWISLVVIVLFTEIFAVGVKMKEEQDRPFNSNLDKSDLYDYSKP